MDSNRKSTKWNRRRKGIPPCQLCGHYDWCLYAGPAGNPDAVICARVESAKRVGDKGAGWLHILHDDDGWRDLPRRRTIRSSPAAPTIDFAKMAAECEQALGPMRLQLLAAELGVKAASLDRLQVGWSEHHRSFTFPMQNDNGVVRGIRLRRTDGSKWAVKGSRQGLFIPRLLNTAADRLLICEGATDCASLLDLGFDAAGRPSCNGGNNLLPGLILTDDRFIPREVVIVADADAPGQRGAWKLATTLVSYVELVRIISPPDGIKDARQWITWGADRHTIEAAIDAVPALQLTYGVKAVAI